MTRDPRMTDSDDVTTRLARLLPEMAVALYESTPHHRGGTRLTTAESLTGRQREAVVFLAHRGAEQLGIGILEHKAHALMKTLSGRRIL